VWRYIPRHPYDFMAWYLVKQRDIFTFLMVIRSNNQVLYRFLLKFPPGMTVERQVGHCTNHYDSSTDVKLMEAPDLTGPCLPVLAFIPICYLAIKCFGLLSVGSHRSTKPMQKLYITAIQQALCFI
jgi:hypothetical protein